MLNPPGCQCNVCRDCLHHHFEIVVRERYVRNMVCPVCGQPDIDNSQQTDTHFQLLSIMVIYRFLVITVINLSIFGDRSFGAVGPRIWNSLPRGLRTLDISYKHFKRLLKTCIMFRLGHSESKNVWKCLQFIGKTKFYNTKLSISVPNHRQHLPGGMPG